MRCLKCGGRLTLTTRFCPNCGVPIPPGQKKKAKIQLFILAAFLLLTFVTGSLFLYYDSIGKASEQTKNILLYSLTASVSALVLFCVISLIIEYIRFIIRRPVWGSVVLAVILFLAGGGYFVYWQHNFNNQFPTALASIQDELNEAAAAKIMGDSIMAGNPTFGASMIRVEAVAQMAVDRLNVLSVPGTLKNYRAVAIDWAEDIVTAAKNNKLWKDLGSQPNDFQLKLSDSRARELTADSAQKITMLQAFGDSIIERNDRDTMRYIAAKLLVQEHWLNGILYSGSSLLSFNLIRPALAIERPQIEKPKIEEPNIEKPQIETPNIGGALHPRLFTHGKTIRDVCPNRAPNVATFYCAEEAADAAEELGDAAAGYVQGNKDARASWNKAKDDAKNYLPGNWPNGFPATATSFRNECQSKGGTFGSDTISESRLPTTELGYTCKYQQGDKTCWDYLTYSGGRYAGGASGCPEQNLLPPTPESKKGGEWDGTYSMNGVMQCSGNIPLFPNSLPLNYTVVVKNNQIMANGRLITSINGSIATSAQIQSTTIPNPKGDSFTMTSVDISYGYFYKEGNTRKFRGSAIGSADLTLSWGEVRSEFCSGDFAGSEQ